MCYADAALLLADSIEEKGDHHDALASLNAQLPVGYKKSYFVILTSTVLQSVNDFGNLVLEVAVALYFAALDLAWNAFTGLIQVERRIVKCDSFHYKFE